MHLRKATIADLARIIELFADDFLGKTREVVSDPLDAGYIRAFEIIDADTNQDLLVLQGTDGLVVGTLQITYIQYLNLKGTKRALIESVHIDGAYRGKGCGKTMLRLAIERAKERGATLVQLTSDKARTNALRFYEQLGFVATHEGFKMRL